jgi:hypothetical protein
MPADLFILPHIPLKDQLCRLQILNDALEWGFKKDHFSKVDLAEPVLTKAKQRALLFVIFPSKGSLSSAQRTFFEHTRYLKKRADYTNKRFFIDPVLDFKNLKLTGHYRPGFYSMVFDYGENQNIHDGVVISRLVEANNDYSFASSHGLSALMMFPDYGYSMDGDNIPYLAMPGYKFQGPRPMTIGCSCRYGKELSVEIIDPDTHHLFYAAPTVKKINY